MSERDRSTNGVAVPRGRLNRFVRLSATAAGIGAEVIGKGLGAVVTGRPVDLQGIALSPGNALRLTRELSRMRGAAMKVGQLMSMDAGDLLPPEFASVLAQLRSSAHPMPPRQLRTVLNKAWGEGWYGRFKRFDLRPLAAASIGQVHRAITPDGRDLAVKVQFPGVRESIDSDVDNVGTLIRLSGLMPSGFEVRPLLEEAKRQLHEEADYLAEADALAEFNGLLQTAPEYRLPALHRDLTTPDVLAMEYLSSRPLETLDDAPQALRDRVVTELFALSFRELFEFRRVQSDPNLANYRFDPQEERLVLLDFGATRTVPPDLAEAYRDLLRAGSQNDIAGLRAASQQIGYIGPGTPAQQIDFLLPIMNAAFEPLRAKDGFDFAASDLAVRLRDQAMALGLEAGYREVPPMDVLYLHRKFGGLYLLARRMRAQVDIQMLATPYLRAGSST
ncbi:MAG: AarF/ABC1/UbiB kinase family protein [Maricaulis sp.]|nr:AarF/ABC1/UbiB kinase family protein [Maricaulis sp.]